MASLAGVIAPEAILLEDVDVPVERRPFAAWAYENAGAEAVALDAFSMDGAISLT